MVLNAESSTCNTSYHRIIGRVNREIDISWSTGKATAPPPSLVIPATKAPEHYFIRGFADVSYVVGMLHSSIWENSEEFTKNHGDGEKVAVREVAEVVMLYRLVQHKV